MHSRTSEPRFHLSYRRTHPLSTGISALSDVGVTLRSAIDWLRSGYPDEAPPTGYSPLLALSGPLALTPRQIQRIVDELDGAAAHSTEIAVAITKATDRLPTQTQIRAVALALHAN
jgi:hypothetical protein